MRAILALLLLFVVATTTVHAQSCNISPIPIYPKDLFDGCAWINFLIFVAILFIILPLVIGLLAWLALGVFYAVQFLSCSKSESHYFYTAEEKRTCRICQTSVGVLLVLVAIVGIFASISYSASVQVALVSVFEGGREIIAETNKTGTTVRAVANSLYEFLNSYLVLKNSIRDIHLKSSNLHDMVQSTYLQGFNDQYQLLFDTNGQLGNLAQNLEALKNTSTAQYPRAYLPQANQVPKLQPLLDIFIAENQTIYANADTAYNYMKQGYDMFEQNSGSFIAPFEKVKQAENFVDQFYSFENVTGAVMSKGNWVEIAIRTIESIRLVAFSLGFGLIIIVFPWVCTCFCADKDDYLTEKRYATCYRGVMCCHASVSCCLILGFVLFGAFNIALFTVLIPGCVGVRKPDFYLLQGNRSAAAFTRSLLSCQGNATIFDIAEKTAGLDISALKDTKTVDEFFAKLNTSVTFLNYTYTHKVLSDAKSLFVQFNSSMAALSATEQLVIVPILIQWQNNMTLIQNNLTDPTGQAQTIVMNMLTTIQQVIDVIQAQIAYFDYLTTNQTTTIVEDFDFFDDQSQMLPGFITSEIIPEAYAIITWVRKALQSAKCASVSDTFDATYWNVCYWNNSSIALIGLSSFLVAILLFIMFPLSCITQKRYKDADDQTLYNAHLLDTDDTDTYGT